MREAVLNPLAFFGVIAPGQPGPHRHAALAMRYASARAARDFGKSAAESSDQNPRKQQPVCRLIVNISNKYDLIKNVLNFESDNKNKPELLKLYCKLNKALHGLKQSPRLWYKHLLEALTKLGFEVLPYDEAIFIHNKLKIIIICHVDDLIFTGPNNNEISNIVKELTKTIKIEYISEIY